MNQDISDSEIDRWIIEQLRAHAPTALKAPITAAFAFCAAASFSGSIGKASIIAAACLLASVFTAWRRFLEPLAFWSCAAAIALWCEPDLLTKTKSAVALIAATAP